MATQVSYALMWDCRLCSLVFGHAHSAQILEFSRLACSERFSLAFMNASGHRNKPKSSGNCSLAAERDRIAPAQPSGNEGFRERFPQANGGFSGNK